MAENKRVPCPSCHAEIEVDANGNAQGSDVAHFDMHKPLEDRLTKLEQSQTPAPANSGGVFSRINQNLERLLSDDEGTPDAAQASSAATSDD